jgi:serine O-acetyltransferase
MESKHNEKAEARPETFRLCVEHDIDLGRLWEEIRSEAGRVADEEAELASLLGDVVTEASCLGTALGRRLARKLARADMARDELAPLLAGILREHPELVLSAGADLQAIMQRDPACQTPLEPLLFYKGFLAITTYRLSHYLWNHGRRPLALYFQSISSEVFGVDIHPAARIGCGVLLDHATSFVVGETAIIEDDVSILHEVTLGGTGKQSGARHPIVRSGVLIGAGAKILGRVEIGTGAKIGAGSVVLSDVPPHKTVAGVPAEIVGESAEENPALAMDQSLDCFDSLESSGL